MIWVKRQNRIIDTDLYCITSEEHSRGRSNIEVVSEIIEAGVKVIQYREKEKKLLHKYNECLKIRDMTKANLKLKSLLIGAR